ncbi:MAG: hypothetical protein JO306_13105, partial [Gemmatimonadetes bacterium]|nr:hypothetical protein [Gemmatimonadota bacterium]
MPRPRLRRALSALLAAGAAALAAAAALPATQAGETRTGTLNVVWQTRGTQNALAAVNVFLVDDRGQATLLDASPAELAPLGGLLRVTGRRVTITGDLRLPARGAPVLRVRSIRAADGIRAAISYRVQQGPRAYVVLLCRFPDLAAADPHPASTYQQWMGSAYPGLDDYWRENSGGRISFTSAVVGPFV